MSTKSTGAHLLSPDKPAKFFSEQLESDYECLHRLVYSFINIPDSIKSCSLFIEHAKGYYYGMRVLLEEDFAVSRQVVQSLPVPDISETLKLLARWEQEPDGQRAYEDRDPLEVPKLPNASNCWFQYRVTLYEATRALNITSERVTESAPEREPRRYPWITDWCWVSTIGDLFEQAPEQFTYRGDRVLWQRLAEDFSRTVLPSDSQKLFQMLYDKWHSFCPGSIESDRGLDIPELNAVGMSGGKVSPTFWRNRAFPLLLNRFSLQEASRRSTYC